MAAKDPAGEIFARLSAQSRAAAPDHRGRGDHRAVRKWPAMTPISSLDARAAARTSPVSHFRFLGLQLRGGRKRRVIAVEPAACPSLTRGKYAYDFGDTAHLTPLVKMHTLGSTFIPPGFHAGGLRYHGMSPLVSHVYELGLIEARAYHQVTCFEAGVEFARCEGIVPAPEASHAVRCAIDEALRCKKEGKKETILFNLSGHGHFDMQAYINYFEGKLVDQDYDEKELAMALAGLPSVAA